MAIRLNGEKLRGRVLWFSFVAVFLVGMLVGWAWTTNQHRCRELVDAQQRTVAVFVTLAQAARDDGNLNMAHVLDAYVEAARVKDLPTC